MLDGYTDFMISQWLTEYELVPLELVVLGRKRIPKEGIFGKSVITKTGQDIVNKDNTEPQAAQRRGRTMEEIANKERRKKIAASASDPLRGKLLLMN